MQLVTYAGTYQGKVVEHAVNLSTGGFPQLVLTLDATAQYDFEKQCWADWTPYGEGITAYLVLAGKDGKPTKNAEQVMKVFGWDGISYKELNNLDIDGKELQNRVSDEEYNGKAQKKVQWIDLKDATPSSGLGAVTRLDDKALSDLDRKFAATLKQTSGGKVKTAKAPTTPPPAPAAKTPGIISTPPSPTGGPDPISEDDANDAQTRDHDCIEPPAPPVAAAPPAMPKKGRPPKPAPKDIPNKKWDANSAWGEIVRQTEGVPDEARAEAWSTVSEKVASGKTETDITQDEWGKIIKQTVAECQLK